MDISVLKEFIHTFNLIEDANLGNQKCNFNEPFS